VGSPMSGERTLDRLIGYCLMCEIETVPTKSLPATRACNAGKLVRVGNIAFDCHSHDTGVDVRGWILSEEDAYEFLSVPYWYSSHYTFNSSRWERGAWDGAVDAAIKSLWEKVDAHKAAVEQAKESREQTQRQSANERRAKFEEQFR